MTASADTIVAVSSPPGRSLRGLIRVSGSDAFDVTAAFSSFTPAIPPRVPTAVRLHSPPIPALAAAFPGPHSFTGEDVVELQLPGNPALLDRLLHEATAAGARLAEPGEFTFRAFTAGRIDLTQAEGIASTIAAVSEGQLRAAAMLRDGELGRVAAELVDELGTQLALVEAGIDFVDQEDVVPIGPGDLDRQLAASTDRLETLLARSRSWGAIEALPRVVLVGRPSAGKSTLFNALLGRQRAVISPMPGTTRDVLAEPLELTTASGQTIEVMLVDIAGLDAPTAALDRDAQAAARRAIDRADLILHLHAPRPVSMPTSTPTDHSPETQESEDDQPRLPPLPASTPRLTVRTMVDVTGGSADGSGDGLSVSAVTGQGLDALRRAMAHHVGDRGVSATSQMLVLQPRHEAALRAAVNHLHRVRELLAPQRASHAIEAVELVAGSLRAALDELAGLGGQLTPDDVIGRVFATFCVGK